MTVCQAAPWQCLEPGISRENQRQTGGQDRGSYNLRWLPSWPIMGPLALSQAGPRQVLGDDSVGGGGGVAGNVDPGPLPPLKTIFVVTVVHSSARAAAQRKIREQRGLSCRGTKKIYCCGGRGARKPFCCGGCGTRNFFLLGGARFSSSTQLVQHITWKGMAMPAQNFIISPKPPQNKITFGKIQRMDLL